MATIWKRHPLRRNSYFLKTANGNSETSANGLTNREREIVQMLAEAKSNKEVAQTLSISVKTVETHRTTAMRKLGVNSIVELVKYAMILLIKIGGSA